jgi:hypothetical protein
MLKKNAQVKMATMALLCACGIASRANAAAVTGGFAAVWLSGTGSYSGASDLQDATTINFDTPASYTHGTGDFSSLQFLSNVNIAPGLSGVGPSSNSSTSTPDALTDFFTFGPGGQFQFNLTSLDEYYNNGIVDFYGYGTVVDTSNVESPSFAQFTANGFNDNGAGVFSGGSFTFATTAPVPEPATMGIVTAASAMLLRRRRVSR